MATSSTAPVRKWIVRITIGSFSLAALMGIVALLGRDFGETQGRILLTTVLIGVVSIAVLCYLATAGLRWQPVGLAGGVAVLVPMVTGLLMIWGNAQSGPGEDLLRTFGVGAIVAASLAQASLLLALADRGRALVARLLMGTLLFAAVLAVMSSVSVLGYNPVGDGFYRVLGVVAILDVLGTVVVAALVKFGADSERRADAEVTLPAALAERVAAHAKHHGQTTDAVVAEAVERYLGESAAG